MNLYRQLMDLLPIIYPEFYTKVDGCQNEFILLDTGGEHQAYITQVIADKTQFEAVENHVHIFETIKKSNYKMAREIGISIAQNLCRVLERTYPSKEFVVYFTINQYGAILRFHQVWENEPPYFDETAQYDAEVIAFHTSR